MWNYGYTVFSNVQRSKHHVFVRKKASIEMSNYTRERTVNDLSNFKMKSGNASWGNYDA